MQDTERTNRAEFDRLLIEQMPRAVAWMTAKYKNKTFAEDVVQQAAVNAMENWRAFAPGTNFGGWFFMITRNVALDHLKGRYGGQRKMHFDIMDAPEDLFAHAERQFNAVLAKEMTVAMPTVLSRESCDAMTLLLTGLSYDAVAAKLGVRVGSVKSRISRGRAVLGLFADNMRDPKVPF